MKEKLLEKLLDHILNDNTEKLNTGMMDEFIGKYVIVRSSNEGVNAGYVKALDNTGVVITQARRIYYHRPKDRSVSWYEGVANTGLSEDSKISPPVEEKLIVEDYSLTICTEVGKNSIINMKSNEQN